MPSLKSIVEQRFPQSKIVYCEFITGLDNKIRYFKPLRLEFYKKMVAWIKELGPENGGLAQILDESAVKHCGLH